LEVRRIQVVVVRQVPIVGNPICDARPIPLIGQMSFH